MADEKYPESKYMDGLRMKRFPADEPCVLHQRHTHANKFQSDYVGTTTVYTKLKSNQTLKTILNSNPLRFCNVLYINAYRMIIFAFLQFPKEILYEFDNCIEVERIESLEGHECVVFKNQNGKVCLLTRHSLQGEDVFKAIEKHIVKTKATTVTVSIEEFINHFTCVNTKAHITESKTKENDNNESCRKKLYNKGDQNEFTNNATSIHKYQNGCYDTSHLGLLQDSAISLSSCERPLKVQPPQESVVFFAYPFHGTQYNNQAIPSYHAQVSEGNGHSEITPSSLPYGQYGEVGNRAEQLHTHLTQTTGHRQNISTNPTPVRNSQPVNATNSSNSLRTDGFIRGNTVENGSHSGTLSPNVPAEPIPLARHPDYRDHYPRLLSYTNWPGHVRQDPTHLCKAGFFYTGNADLVRCFQCGIGLKDFRPDDVPLVEHVRHSSDCNFLLELLGPGLLAEYKRNVLGSNSNLSTVQQQQHQLLQEQPHQHQVPNVGAPYQYGLPTNTPQPSQQPAQQHQITTPYGQAPHLGPSDFRSTAMNHASVTNQHYTTPTSQQEPQQPGQHGPIPPNTAAGAIYRHPEYASLDTRLASFAKWPPGIMQTPRQIAEAGFYYTGMGDVVRCWACDGGLQKWDPQDDPWIEHCFYFPTCPYAIQQKGSGYIAMVQQHARGNTPVEGQQNNANNSSIAQTSSSTSRIQDDLQKLTIQDNPVLQTVAAHSLLEMGYEDKQIKLAIEKLRRQGTTDPTAEQIVDIIEGGVENIPLNNNTQSTEMHRSTSEVFHENERLKSLLICMTCNENNVNVLFLPCTHHRMCTMCAKTVTNCPLCNRFIQEKVKTYMS